MMSFVVALTLVGLIYMCRTNCDFRCFDRFALCKNLEKEDINQIYGDYSFSNDGDRIESVMEVGFEIIDSIIRQ